MRLRLSIQEKTQGESQYDEAPEQWTELRQEWFVITPLSSREFIQAQGVQSTVSHEGECPWFAGFNSRLRLVSGERIFNVESVVNRDERNRKLDWMLVEVNG